MKVSTRTVPPESAPFESVGPEAEVCQVYGALPSKFLVDYVNGLDVTRDHVRVQRRRSEGGLFGRMVDGFTGKGLRRQIEVNQRLITGLESALHWLTDLTDQVAFGHRAIAQVAQHVDGLQAKVAVIAGYAHETREQLQVLAISVGRRCDELTSELARVDLEQRAHAQLGQVFRKWKSGAFGKLAPAARCYVALEELRWGDFGAYCEQFSGSARVRVFLDDVANASKIQLRDDIGEGLDQRLPWTRWQQPPETDGDSLQALAYYGDWSSDRDDPLTYTISQQPDELPMMLPRLCSANRVVSALVGEVLMGRAR